MTIDYNLLNELRPVEDYWIIARTTFDPLQPSGLIYNHRTNRAFVVEDNHLAVALVIWLYNEGAKVISVEEFRTWASENEIALL